MVTPVEELFVISDLHLGGVYGQDPSDRGFRINTHVKELVDFLAEVRERNAHQRRRTELVINGDFVDFLAEGGTEGNDWRAFVDVEEEAVARLDQIVSRDGGVFESVAALISSGVAVTLLLGNHDLELSVPAVRERLREHLGATRTSGFQFIYDGEAYVVGDTLIEHGNRYDGFNVVDYDVLRRYRSESSRGLPMSPDATFLAPPGSQLVEQIMNPIKVDYAFIDLLKPENDAAIPLLLALEPSLVKDIERINTVVKLQAEAQSRDPVAAATPAQPGNIRATQTAGPKTLKQLLNDRLDARTSARLLALTGEAEQENIRRLQQIAGGRLGRAFSFTRLLFFTKEWEDRVALLLDVFRQVQNEQVFDWSIETEATYHEAAKELSRCGFRNVIFGHTHNPKNVELPEGARYLNTGAWADRMKLPVAVYSQSRDVALQCLKDFAGAIKGKQFAPYVEFLPTFGYIEFDSRGRCRTRDVKQYKSGSVKAL